MKTAKQIFADIDGMSVSVVNRFKTSAPSVGAGLIATFSALLAGAGNYTAQYTPTATSTALANLGDYVAFILDVLTAVGNWFVTNPPGELLIAMSVVMFAMIMIKSFFRRGGGKRR